MEKLIIKKIALEIIGIVVVSAVIGLIYNFTLTKPLPLVPEPKQAIADSVLFGSSNFEQSTETATDTNNKINAQVDNYTPLLFPPQEGSVSSTAPEPGAKASENISPVKIPVPEAGKAQNTTKVDIASTYKPEIKQKQYDEIFKQTITYEQVLNMLANPGFQFVDARKPEDYLRGYIGNAVNIYPYSQDSIIVTKVMSLPRNKTLIVYCDGGNCDLSHELALDLVSKFGFKRVFIYSGGWEEWTKKQNKG